MSADEPPLSLSTEVTTPDEGVARPNSPSSLLVSLTLSPPGTELDSSTALVSSLNQASKAAKPLIRSTLHTAGSHQLLSWKTSEFAYRKGSGLPTLARGLFTQRVSEHQHRIAVRGYDKFFNLAELPWVRPAAIEAYTTGPYVLSFKENGCIIFVAALSEQEIVVTSKHSLGAAEGKVTHASKGEEWLLKHLSKVGRTTEQLAHELWQRNETAVFELCDDQFEEHVLAYERDRSGLHLHGLNANTAAFQTRSMEQVDAFANEWGFIPTRWIVLPTLHQVHQLTDRIGMSGSWEGEPIEGFVIRTHMPNKLPEVSGVAKPPYEPGQAWFYKVKFDEPYLMYRDWRELTRKMLSQKAAWEAQLAGPSQHPADAANEAQTTAEAPECEVAEPSTEDQDGISKSALKKERKKLLKAQKESEARSRAAAIRAGLAPPDPPQARSKRPETLLFIQWCYERLFIHPQPHLFATFNEGKGIIALRNKFLEYLASPEGQAKLGGGGGPKKEVQEDTRPFNKTVITMVAVPGCGKTVLAVALQDLFGFAHTQSDDVKSKKGFLLNVEKELQKHDVVLADKNNHHFQQRDELIELTQRLSDPNQPVKKGKKEPPPIPRIRTVAIAWNLDTVPLNMLHRICSDRILTRGDRHQTLRADTSGSAGTRDHETILWRFLEQLQPFNSAQSGEGTEGFGDAKFDEIITLDVQQDLASSLDKVLDRLCPLFELPMPSQDRMALALQKGLSYEPPNKKASKTEKQEAKVRYFGVAVEVDLLGLLDPVLDGNAFYAALKRDGRVTSRPHITLAHSSEGATPRWERYVSLCASGEVEFEVTLDEVVWDERVMAIRVSNVKAEKVPELQELQGDWSPHVTVGTAYKDIRPVGAIAALRRHGVEGIKLNGVRVHGRLQGMNH